ncbi:hypothetical protein [Streptomyces avermitilis]|uniref:hypothetical protein n=1 Tax=Streptomyces avermitilis TaxID=33903 RepID=UPI0036ABABD5
MAGTDLSQQIPVFDFMVVRAPEVPDTADSRRRYVRDDRVVSHGGVPAREEVDVTSPGAESTVGRLVHQKVVCDAPPKGDRYEDLLVALLGLLKPRLPVCPGPETHGPAADTNGAGPEPLEFGGLDRHAHLEHGGYFYLLPDTLDQVTGTPLVRQLIKALPLLEAERVAATGPESRRLARALQKLFDNTPLRQVVFQEDGAYTADFTRAKRALFDALYLLFVLRRWTRVTFQQITDGLCALHVLEALAGPDKQADAGTLRVLLAARPVVHPMFTRLFYYLRPFNDVRPIGIGDLKVVRQWLTAYRPGEISHIHNIVKGESKTRDHRRMERSEDVFTFSDSHSTETSTDSASTERFELKREAEEVLRTELNVNASANTTLSYGPSTAMRITASVGAGFAYNRASEEHTTTTQSFAREVVAKAVSRVESRTATTRSMTRTSESEEKNKQVFDNREGDGHVSGIYRWIDKEYTAQLFNYGKRLMFEFIVPEPAAFWAESKLRAYEAELDVPQPPQEPVYEQVTLPEVADPLTPEEFERLGRLYDLTGLVFPEKRTATLVNRDNGQARFEETGLSADDLWITKTYPARLDGGKDHRITGLRLAGKTEYRDYDTGAPDNESDRNLFALTANGSLLVDYDDTGTMFRMFWPMNVTPVADGPELDYDDVAFTIGGQEVTSWRLTVDAVLSPGPRLLGRLRRDVIERIRNAESQLVTAANRKLELAYESELAAYRNRLAELKAVTVAEVLRGGSDAANRAVMDEEIKKHCLTMITKEFDSEGGDDVLAGQKALGTRDITAVTTRFEVRPKGNSQDQTETTARFAHVPQPATPYPAIDIKETRSKGPVVQFLEQAFEWERLSYVCYPYFWAEQPRWIELMNRFDDADPVFGSFLRAGMVRVLVAVTPGYCDAVLHYLDSRQPWNSGPAPVIGDKLFIPLHEEIRKQQDDRYGGVPEGEPWTFTVPTSLVYLHGSADGLPDIAAERARAEAAQSGNAQHGKVNTEP